MQVPSGGKQLKWHNREGSKKIKKNFSFRCQGWRTKKGQKRRRLLKLFPIKITHFSFLVNTLKEKNKSLKKKVLPLPANVRLVQQSLPCTDSLAYLYSMTVTEKSFKILTLGRWWAVYPEEQKNSTGKKYISCLFYKCSTVVILGS